MTSRTGFVQQALLQLEPGVDIREPGAAITIELCGSSQHDGRCPLAPHQTAAERSVDGRGALGPTVGESVGRGTFGGELVVLRIVFAAASADETVVRSRIIRALQHGSGAVSARWRLYECSPAALEPDEIALAARIANG
jgi:hypothetical protein